MTEHYEQRLMNVSDLEVRMAEGEATRLVGHAAVFNSLSENLGGFREIIAPGAFANSIGEGADIKALWNHNSDNVIGRTTAGTLRVSEDDVGLRVEIFPPESGKRFVESVQRGDVSQMSFGFMVAPNGDRFDEDEDGMLIRTLTEVRLFEVSPVAFPAYRATTIDQRRIEHQRQLIEHKMPSQAVLSRIAMKRRQLDRLTID